MGVDARAEAALDKVKANLRQELEAISDADRMVILDAAMKLGMEQVFGSKIIGCAAFVTLAEMVMQIDGG